MKTPKNSPSSLFRRPTVLGVLILLLLGGGLYYFFKPARNNTTSTAYYQVKRGNFTVSVVEGGTLTAVSEVSIRNEVEGTARIISIVPEGSYVKKGDLLVELDSSQAQDQVNLQQINFEKAKFAVQQAEAQLEIMRSATNSDFTAAELKLQLAKLDLQKYVEGQQAVDFIEASNKVVQIAATLEVNKDTYFNSTNLASKGYETRQKVEGDRLAVINTVNQLIIATNSAWMLQKFETVKSLAKFRADVTQAQQELERVVSQNRRKMAQFEADLESQKNTLELSEQKLERDKRNLAATKIFAPQDGLVVFQVSENRFSSESLIEGGATVRNRQELIKLPDLSRMKVTIKVHESHVGMVRPGQQAYVTLDAQPDIRYDAIVERVAPLPDTQSRWGNPNLKVYNTDIYLSDAIPTVKPGVSARAEIVITNIENVLSVPIQAVTTLKGKQVVYLASGNTTEPRPVEVGLFNTKFIEITKGIAEGDRVLLSPPFDTQEKESENGEIRGANGSKTNRPATKPSPTGPGVLPTGTAGQPIASAAPAGTAGDPSRAIGTADAQRGGPDANAIAERGQRPGGFNREEFMKQWDKNGDGQLDETERQAMMAGMAARFGQGGPPGAAGPGGQPGAGAQAGPGGFNREEMMKQWDKNGDGQIDETERAAMREAFAARMGQGGGQPGQGGPAAGGRGGFNREEMMKQWDKNGDGQLDETERAAMREAMGGGAGGGRRDGGQRRGPGPAGGPPDGASTTPPVGGSPAPGRSPAS